MPAHRRGVSARVDETLTTSLNTTPEINIEDYTMGEIFIPTGSPITALTYYVAPGVGTTANPAVYTPAYVVTTPIAQSVSGGKAYQMPAGLFGAGAMKIVSNFDGAIVMTLKG